MTDARPSRPARPRRRLTAEERQILDFLLSAEPASDRPAPISALREQAAAATVTDNWDCCPSVELAGDADDPPPLSESGGPLIEARHRREPLELMLFTTPDHRLPALELVHNGDENPTELPAASEFTSPHWYEDWRPLITAPWVRD